MLIISEKFCIWWREYIKTSAVLGHLPYLRVACNRTPMWATYCIWSISNMTGRTRIERIFSTSYGGGSARALKPAFRGGSVEENRLCVNPVTQSELKKMLNPMQLLNTPISAIPLPLCSSNDNWCHWMAWDLLLSKQGSGPLLLFWLSSVSALSCPKLF